MYSTTKIRCTKYSQIAKNTTLNYTKTVRNLCSTYTRIAPRGSWQKLYCLCLPKRETNRFDPTTSTTTTTTTTTFCFFAAMRSICNFLSSCANLRSTHSSFNFSPQIFHASLLNSPSSCILRTSFISRHALFYIRFST